MRADMIGSPKIKSWVPALMMGALLALPALAETAEEHFPGYARLCGYPLVVASTASVAQARLNKAGEPVIVLDPVLSEPEQSHRRIFMIAHECAHHRLSHVTKLQRRKRRQSRRIVRDHELSADCWAAETLAEARMDRTLEVMEDRFFRAGLYSPGGGYPAGVQRASIIRACAESGRTRARAASATQDARTDPPSARRRTNR